MSTILFANNAVSTLASNITSGQTTLTVAAGTGVLFPNPSAGQYFLATLIPASTGTPGEIVQVTAVSTDTFTIVRGQEGTTPASYLAGDQVANDLTAGTMSAFLQSATLNPVRTVSGSGAFTITTADLNGTIAMINSGARSATLPTGVANGTYTILDVASNFNVNPVTITYPTIPSQPGPGGATTALLNVNKSRTTFSFVGSGGAGSNQWGGP